MSIQSLPQNSLDNYGGRHYFLDWIRVLAFAFLIFYHTGMMFVSWGFHIESGHNSLFLKTIMLLTSNWRLDILFIVSGVAISFMVTKMPLKAFAWQRVVKLYLPLLFAVVVVVAPQSYYEAIQKGVYQGNFWQFWSSQYFTFTWDERMQAPFPTFNHMWYVFYLFHYSLVLLPLMSFMNSEKGRTVLEKFEKQLAKGSRIIWLPLAIYIINLLVHGNDKVTHAFYNDWYGHCIFLFAMIMGLLFVRMPKIWQSFEDNRKLALLVGLGSYGGLLFLFLSPEGTLPFERDDVWGLLALVVKWSWIALIIGYARKYLNFSNRTLRYANGAVYPFFILHQTVIIVLGYQVIGWELSGIAEYMIIVAGTFLICGLINEALIKRANVLRLLFGLKWLPQEKKKRC